jgi:hypothetical protein
VRWLLLIAIPLAAAPTYEADVRPLLDRHCTKCHRAGEIGPMALTNYAEVRPWAKAIRDAVVSKTMPPWFADRKVGHFANDPSLSNAEIATIRDWVESGAQRGTPVRISSVSGREEWQIGKPDWIATMPRAIAVPASKEMDYQFVMLPGGFAKDRWVTAAEVRPGDRAVVHHLVVYVREAGSDWLKGAEPGVPFVPARGSATTKSDILIVYAPGAGPMRLPSGMAKKIPAGADLVLQIHYTPKGRATTDRSQIALQFGAAPDRRVLTLQMANENFVVPAGDAAYRVTVSGTLPQPALLLGFLPHMHLRGRRFEYEIVGEGGRVEALLRVDPYRFQWQLYYALAEPLQLAAGTRLRFTATYDNSRNNPLNPDPTMDVHVGEQSRDEMMVGFFDVAVDPKLDKNAFFVRH